MWKTEQKCGILVGDTEETCGIKLGWTGSQQLFVMVVIIIINTFKVLNCILES